ncbi:MAG: hypothetical protein ACXW5U_12470 [Thermoanaerobaculia bacterium]
MKSTPIPGRILLRWRGVLLGLAALALAVVLIVSGRFALGLRQPCLLAVSADELAKLQIGNQAVAAPEGSRFVAASVTLGARVRWITRHSVALIYGDDGYVPASAVADSSQVGAFVCDDSDLLLQRHGRRYSGLCRVMKGKDPFLGLPVAVRTEMTAARPVFVFAVPRSIALRECSLSLRRLEVTLPLKKGARVRTKSGIEISVAQADEAPIPLLRVEVKNGSAIPFRASGSTLGLVRADSRHLRRGIWARLADPWPTTEVDPASWIPLTEAGLVDVTGGKPGDQRSTQSMVLIPPGQTRSLALPFFADVAFRDFALAVFSEETFPIGSGLRKDA